MTRDRGEAVIRMTCPASRVPPSSRPLATPSRPWLILSALAVTLGLLGMHTLLTEHHSSASSHVASAIHSAGTEAHVHATDAVHAVATLAGSTSGCSEECEATGAALCMAVITGLVLAWRGRRHRPALERPRRYEAPPGPALTARARFRPPLRLLLCVDRT